MTGVVGDDGDPVSEDAIQLGRLGCGALMQQGVEAGEEQWRGGIGLGDGRGEHLLDVRPIRKLEWGDVAGGRFGGDAAHQRVAVRFDEAWQQRGRPGVDQLRTREGLAALVQ